MNTSKHHRAEPSKQRHRSAAAWLIFACAAASCVSGTLRAAEQDAHAQTVIASPHIQANTAALLKLRPQQLRQLLNIPAASSDATTPDNLAELLVRLTDGHDAYFAVDIPVSNMHPSVRVILPGLRQTTHKHLRAEWSKLLPRPAGWRNGLLSGPVIGGDLGVLDDEYTRDIDPKLAPPSIAEFRAAHSSDDYPIQAMIVPPRYVYQMLTEMLPTLPEELGGGDTSVLTRGLRWMAIRVNATGDNLSVLIQSEDDASAEALAERLPMLAKAAFAQAKSLVPMGLRPVVERFVSAVQARAERDQIIVTFADNQAGSATRQLLLATADLLDGPLSRHERANRMKRIVLGMLNYESATLRMPWSRDAEGRKLLSWRVHILPYLGDEERKLYQLFRLNEPWDSDHNRKLIPLMPEAFSHMRNRPWQRSGLSAGKTCFLAPVGKGTIYGQEQQTRIRHIVDGTSKTLALVQVKPELAVPWTAPRDYQFDPRDPGAGMAWDAHDNRCGVMSCDGAWHALSRDIDDQQLLLLFQMNDGMPVRFE